MGRGQVPTSKQAGQSLWGGENHSRRVRGGEVHKRCRGTGRYKTQGLEAGNRQGEARQGGERGRASKRCGGGYRGNDKRRAPRKSGGRSVVCMEGRWGLASGRASDRSKTAYSGCCLWAGENWGKQGEATK